MKAVIQRVSSASVSVQENIISTIDTGLLVLLGISEKDNKLKTEKMCNKILNLRVFSEKDKNNMELSVKQIRGSVLIVSQFTLYAECNSGNRPSFFRAANRKHAKHIYNELVNYMNNQNIDVQYGRFGENMDISSINVGPMTIIYEV